MSRFIALLLASILWLGGSLQAAADYRAYAEGMLANLPAGVTPRPDLESTLDSLVSAYRREKGKRALKPDDMLRRAARAQSLDMMLGGYVGHQSREGHRFASRFKAYAGDPDLYPARGENAARDTQKGDADQVKARRLFQQWIDSGGHRRNMLTPDYAYVSTGVMQRGNKIWAVQMFWAEPRKPGSNLLFQIR